MTNSDIIKRIRDSGQIDDDFILERIIHDFSFEDLHLLEQHLGVNHPTYQKIISKYKMKEIRKHNSRTKILL